MIGKDFKTCSSGVVSLHLHNLLLDFCNLLVSGRLLLGQLFVDDEYCLVVVVCRLHFIFPAISPSAGGKTAAARHHNKNEQRRQDGEHSNPKHDAHMAASREESFRGKRVILNVDNHIFFGSIRQIERAFQRIRAELFYVVKFVGGALH